MITFSVDLIGSNQRISLVFLKAHLKETLKPIKNPTLLFLWKIYCEVKNKISSTFVQLTVNFFYWNKTNSNEIWRTWRKEKNSSTSLRKILLVIFFSSVKLVYFNQFFCLPCIQAVSDVGPYQTIYWKYTLCRCWTIRACIWTWRETAEFVWELFSLFSVRILLPSLATLEWIDQQYFAKKRWGTFLYPHIRMP